MASKAEDRAGMTGEKFPPRIMYGSSNKPAGVMLTEPYLSLAEHESIVAQLRAKLKVAEEALDKISKFFVTVDRGRFGAFIGAGAVDIARDALKFLRGESGVGGD